MNFQDWANFCILTIPASRSSSRIPPQLPRTSMVFTPSEEQMNRSHHPITTCTKPSSQRRDERQVAASSNKVCPHRCLVLPVRFFSSSVRHLALNHQTTKRALPASVRPIGRSLLWCGRNNVHGQTLPCRSWISSIVCQMGMVLTIHVSCGASVAKTT